MAQEIEPYDASHAMLAVMPDDGIVMVPAGELATGRVQPMPPLSEDERAEMTASIREHGVQVPVDAARLEIDGLVQAVVIDGNNRAAIAAELGIEVPVRSVRSVTTLEEAVAYARRVNLVRRHLAPDDRRRLVSEMAAEGKTQSQIAAELGVSQQTVSRDAGITKVGNSSRRGRPHKPPAMLTPSELENAAQDRPAAAHDTTDQPERGPESPAEPSAGAAGPVALPALPSPALAQPAAGGHVCAWRLSPSPCPDCGQPVPDGMPARITVREDAVIVRALGGGPDAVMHLGDERDVTIRELRAKVSSLEAERDELRAKVSDLEDVLRDQVTESSTSPEPGSSTSLELGPVAVDVVAMAEQLVAEQLVAEQLLAEQPEPAAVIEVPRDLNAELDADPVANPFANPGGLDEVDEDPDLDDPFWDLEVQRLPDDGA